MECAVLSFLNKKSKPSDDSTLPLISVYNVFPSNRLYQNQENYFFIYDILLRILRIFWCIIDRQLSVPWTGPGLNPFLLIAKEGQHRTDDTKYPRHNSTN